MREGNLLGAHMSIAGGLPRAIGRGVEVGCEVLQVFVKNASQWKGKDLTDDEVEEFRRKYTGSPLRCVVGHSSYLINLASPDRELWKRSVEALGDEMQRAEKLGLEYLVVHPGAHMESGEAAGIERITAALEEIHASLGPTEVRIALETTAGQGTSLGCRFEHLRDLLGASSDSSRLAVCFDTCHVFAAGYDLRSEASCEATLEKFNDVVGLDRIKLLHLNDSKRELGSRVDRHDHIGEGSIGLCGFGWIMKQSSFSSTPKILETPKGNEGEEDLRNLATLRLLAANGGCP